MELNESGANNGAEWMSSVSLGDSRDSMCESMWDSLCRFIDEELDSEETTRVLTHLSGCESCTGDLAWLRESSGALSNTPQAAPPVWLRDQILNATIRKPSAWERILNSLRPILRPVSAMSAMAAAGIAAFVMYRSPSPPVHDTGSGIVKSHLGSSPLASGDLLMVGPSGHSGEVVRPEPLVRPESAIIGARKPIRTVNESSQPNRGELVAKSTKPSTTGPKLPATRPSSTGPSSLPETTGDARLVASDMMDIPVSSDPMLMDMSEMPMPKLKPGREAEPVTNHLPEPSPVAPVRMRLVSTSSGELTRHGMTLADLKQELRSRNLDNERAIADSIRARQLRLSIFKGSF